MTQSALPLLTGADRTADCVPGGEATAVWRDVGHNLPGFAKRAFRIWRALVTGGPPTPLSAQRA